MRLLVDTSVIVDALRKRESRYPAARKLLALGYLGEFELWISLSQMGDLMYLLSNGGKEQLADRVAEELRRLRTFVRVCPAGEAEVDAAIVSGWGDLEDALLHETARSIKADAIVTHNAKDLTRSRLPVYTCEQWFAHLEKDERLVYEEVEMG